jgi:hypothetical protein
MRAGLSLGMVVTGSQAPASTSSLPETGAARLPPPPYTHLQCGVQWILLRCWALLRSAHGSMVRCVGGGGGRGGKQVRQMHPTRWQHMFLWHLQCSYLSSEPPSH